MVCLALAAPLACSTLVVLVEGWPRSTKRLKLFASGLKCKVETSRVHLAFLEPRDGVAGRCVGASLRLIRSIKQNSFNPGDIFTFFLLYYTTSTLILIITAL